MEINLNLLFSIISAIGTIGGVTAVVITLQKDRKEQREARDAEIKVHTEYQTNMSRDMLQVKTDITDIKHTLGNGGYTGIRADVASLKNECVGLRTRQEDVLERLDKVEDKVTGS